MPLYGQIELGLGTGAEEVAAADKRAYESGGWLDGDDGGFRHPSGIGEDGGHGLLGGLLSSWFQRRRDAQAAAEEQIAARLGCGSEARVVEHEPLHLLDEVGRRIALVGGTGPKPERCIDR